MGADDRVQPRQRHVLQRARRAAHDMLRDEWGFDGVVMSDWYGTHSTAPAANAGLDLEMPGPPQWFGEKLAAAVRDGRGRRDRARRQGAPRAHAARAHRPRSTSRAATTGGVHRRPDRPRECRAQAARESFVLLQNERRAPARRDVRTLAVIGPNADVAHVIQGGGSARVDPHASPSRRSTGCARASAPTSRSCTSAGCFSFKRTPVLDARCSTGRCTSSTSPARARGRAGARRARRRAAASRSSARSATACPTSSRCGCTGTVVAAETGEWTFTLVQVGRARLFVDGAVVVDNWNPTGRSDAFMGFGSAELTGTIELARASGDAHRGRVRRPAAARLGGCRSRRRRPADH